MFSLNGRTAAWDQAVPNTISLFTGNGVGALGTGSTRANQELISAPPSEPVPGENGADIRAGNSAFLDSSYAQVQSDVGIVGTLALICAMIGFAVVLGRRCVRSPDGVSWAAFGVLIVSMIDWLGRSSLASYSTGFLTMYILGLLIAASSPPDRKPSTDNDGPGERVPGSPGGPPPTAPTTPIIPAKPAGFGPRRTGPPPSPRPRASEVSRPSSGEALQ